MVKVRRGWYLVDTTNQEKKEKDEKEDELQRRQAVLMKQCDNKITQRRLQAEQREACEKETLLDTQKAINLKQKEIETSHRLAAELSRRKNEEVKQILKFAGVKPSASLSPRCAVNARSRLLEEKVHLESNQAKLLNLWHQDESVEKLQQAEQAKKKQDLHNYLRNQVADNRRRVRERESEENDQDRTMIRQVMQTLAYEEETKLKKKREDAIHRRTEIAAFIAIKNKWEKDYKEVLKHEDERIARTIAEKEAQQKELLDKKIELRAKREATINKLAKKLLDNVCERRERESNIMSINYELYQEEQMLKWAEEPVKLASRKRHAIAENLKEMMRRQKAVAECKANNDAIDAAFARYLTEKYEKDTEEQRKQNDALRAQKIQYGKELKEAITNNRVSYAINIMERQSEIHAQKHLLTSADMEESTGKRDMIARKKEIYKPIKDTCSN